MFSNIHFCDFSRRYPLFFPVLRGPVIPKVPPGPRASCLTQPDAPKNCPHYLPQKSLSPNFILVKRPSRHLIVFIIFLAFTGIVFGIRLQWIGSALPAQATVLYIQKVTFLRSSSQQQPVVQFDAGEYRITAPGTYNLPVSAGDTLSILYNPRNESEWRINQPYWLWFDLWDWYQFVPFTYLLYYVVWLIVRRADPRFRKKREVSEGELISVETVVRQDTGSGQDIECNRTLDR